MGSGDGEGSGSGRVTVGERGGREVRLLKREDQGNMYAGEGEGRVPVGG